MTTHIIILCAGEETRWNNYLGVRKHFIEIEGEKLLNRTIRLVNKHKREKIKIFVVGTDESYKIEGTSLFIPHKNRNDFDADKFLNSKELWNKNGRTIVLFGDVWYSDEAISTILNFNRREWYIFGRPGSSNYTSCPWGEIFAQNFWSEHYQKHYSTLIELSNLYQKKKIVMQAGWIQYRLMLGLSVDKQRVKIHQIAGNFLVIDDFTDDFDWPEDYGRWIEQRRKYLESKKFLKKRNLQKFKQDYMESQLVKQLKKTIERKGKKSILSPGLKEKINRLKKEDSNIYPMS